MGTKQRKKTEKATPTGKEEEVSVSDQLDRAEAAIEQSRVTSLNLQQQWRTHLMQMSYVVVVVALHQTQAPSTSCIKEIKAWNQIHESQQEYLIEGLEAFFLILKDCATELLGVFCVGTLLWCLSLPMPTSLSESDFSSLPYRLSCTVIPVIVSLYFSKKTMGCVAVDEESENGKEQLTMLPERTDRSFPVVLIFHLIVSLSLFFMQYQTQRHVKNRELLQKLKQDLTDAKAGKKVTKKQ